MSCSRRRERFELLGVGFEPVAHEERLCEEVAERMAQVEALDAGGESRRMPDEKHRLGAEGVIKPLRREDCDGILEQRDGAGAPVPQIAGGVPGHPGGVLR